MADTTILIVDDEPTNLAILSVLLQPYYRVLAFTSGERALLAVGKAPRPDLILLDVTMPGMDGYTVLSRLREDPANCDIPVIFVTARDDEKDEELGLKLGAVDYLIKPIKPAIVLARIRTQLERKQALEALRTREVDLRHAQEQLRIAAVAFDSHSGIMVTDARHIILQVNKSFTELTGYSEAEAVGKSPAFLRSGRHDAAFYRNMQEALAHEGRWEGQVWNRRKDGNIFLEWLAVTAVRDSSGNITHYVGSFSDISEPREAERKIVELALYDPLTRLPNRRLLHDRLNHAQTVSNRERSFGALLFMDLDHFKTINETRGHGIGDRLLIAVAARLRAVLRESDTAARLGGDEFVVLLEDLGEKEAAACAAEMIAEKLRAAVKQTFELDGEVYRITSSIGVKLFRGYEEDVDTLLKHTDLALYRAKDAGRDRVSFYDQALQAAADKRAALEAGLHRALELNEFLLFYQPQIDAHGRPIGAEALLRWQPPGGAMVSPADFIPIAEETGLIIPIGNWVLKTACRQLALWASDPATRGLQLAVNISSRQFRQPDFTDQVHQALQDSGADPSCLKLELTESLLLDSVDKVVGSMKALKETGVKFSIDDFGTGYSSLSYLKRLPLDQLKIDQSFVRDIPGDHDACVIAEAIVALGQSLHLDVIAEGVETETQRDFLVDRGCHAYQGYFFARPGPASAVEMLAKNWATENAP